MKKIVSFIAVMILTGITATTFAQNFGATPEDSVNCIINNSLYQEFYSQKNYKDAYEPWKKAIKSCPAYHVNTYIRGSIILKNMIASSKTQADQDKYINELMELYDTRAKYFGEEGNNIARKAKDLTDFRPNEKKKIYELYKEATEKDGKDLDDQYKPLYLLATIEYLKSISANDEQMSMLFDAYDYSSEALEHSLNNAREFQDTKTEEKIKSYINAIEQIIQPFASCDKIIPIYQPKFDKTPNDVALLRKITTTLELKGCTDSELFFKSTENLHKLEPTAKSAFMMGQMLMAKKQESAAAGYFKEAMEKYEDNDSKAKACMLWGQALMASNNYGAARSAFYQVGGYDKSMEGKAQLLVAQMYLSSSASCASHEGNIRGAAWAAYDKAAKAKALDPSIADQADRVMGSARSQWPTTERAFFYGINNGDGYRVGCWIGESTTVRLR